MTGLQQAERVPQMAERPSYNILVVDDNPILANAIECTLAFNGHKVASATNGGDIFGLLAAMQPDILITDMIIPDMDAIDLISDLRRSHLPMKIIAISGNPFLLKMAAQQGADHVLAKPFDLSMLNGLIHEAMN